MTFQAETIATESSPIAAKTSIRKRLLFAYVGILAALAVGVSLLVQFTFNEREAMWQQDIHSRLLQIVARHRADADWDSTSNFLNNWDADKLIQVEVRDLAGKLLYQRLPLPASAKGENVLCPAEVCFDQNKNGLNYRIYDIKGEKEDARSALLRRALALGLFMLWAATWVILLLANRISAPLKKLADQSARLIGTVDDKPIDIPAFNDEVAALARVLETSRQRLRSQVFRDVLTGLYNRRYLLEQLTSMFSIFQRGGHRAVVLVLDIDHFKSVNDTHGHDAGDLVLQSVATSLQASVRQSDLLARFGGEEFIAVLPVVKLHEAQMVAGRILTNVANTKVLLPNGTTLSVTISIGIAVSAPLRSAKIDANELFNSLFALGDEALYEAKQSGRNRFVQSKKIAQIADTLPTPAENSSTMSPQSTEARDPA